MASCESKKPEAIKSVPTPDLEASGTQEEKPKVADQYGAQLNDAKRWLSKQPVGIELSTKEMRAATGTGKPTTQNEIIKDMFECGLLTRVKKGNIYKYIRVDPKKTALNQMRNTSKFLKLVKSK